METFNANCTCWNCLAMALTGRVDFRAGGQSVEMQTLNTGGDGESNCVAKCKRRPELRQYNPITITFDKCPKWQMTDYGYLGWTLALWLG